MLNVKSDRPHYWKAETLDGFDGLRWFRTGDLDETQYGQELAFNGPAVNRTTWNYHEYNPEWDERIRFTVRSLSTELLVGAASVSSSSPHAVTRAGTSRANRTAAARRRVMIGP